MRGILNVLASFLKQDKDIQYCIVHKLTGNKIDITRNQYRNIIKHKIKQYKESL